MALGVIGTSTWALIEGIKTTDGKVGDFWNLISDLQGDVSHLSILYIGIKGSSIYLTESSYPAAFIPHCKEKPAKESDLLTARDVPQHIRFADLCSTNSSPLSAHSQSYPCTAAPKCQQHSRGNIDKHNIFRSFPDFFNNPFTRCVIVKEWHDSLPCPLHSPGNMQIDTLSLSLSSATLTIY